MKNLNKLVHLFLKRLEPLENKNIVVGYSGGADSTALLHILKNKSDKFSFNLKAVFFSHEGSPLIENEVELVKHCHNFCNDLKVDLIVHPLFLEKKKSQSWESSGRIARMNFYENNKPDYVFLGHHKDDQDETTMIQLFRGAGKGISAMKSVENFYCRPFLTIHKVEIYDYLKLHNLSWIEDTTNENLEFTRNFWRKKGLPTIKQYYPQYSQQLALLRDKTTELIQISNELAQVDGVNFLKEGKTISIHSLSDIRLKNLISHFYSLHKTSIDASYVENQINEYRIKNTIEIEKNELILKFENGYLSQKSKINNILKNQTNKL